MQINPYLFFEGRCEEAIDFYRQALDAELVMMLRYGEAPQGAACPGAAPSPDKVMHACLQLGQAQLLMSDGMCSGQPRFTGVSLALTAADDAQARRRFDALADGGQVQQPLAATFFAGSFGMLVDRFGVTWMVSTPTAPAS
jgi:PhnB protein